MSNIAAHVCEVCNEQQSKYRCPGCELYTCSLTCVKSHKQTSSCNGLRDKTAYVSLNDFNDTHLLSDYRFLEESQRDVESSTRLKHSHFSPRYLHILKTKVGRKGVSLRMMPPYMKRHQLNHSYYRIKDEVVEWSVEWLVHESSSKFYSKHLDTCSLLESLTQFQDTFSLKQESTPSHLTQHTEALEDDDGCKEGEEERKEKDTEDGERAPQSVETDPQIPDVLRLPPSELCVFFKVEKMCKDEHDDRRYIQVDTQAILADILKGKSLIEFPTFLIAPPSSTDHYNNCFFTVTKKPC